MINGFSIDARHSRSTIRLWLFHKDAERQAERLQLDRQCAGDRQEPLQNRHDRMVESCRDVEGMSPWVVGDIDVGCNYTSLTHLEVDGCHPCDGTPATASKLLSFLLTGSSPSPGLRCSNPHQPATHPMVMSGTHTERMFELAPSLSINGLLSVGTLNLSDTHLSDLLLIVLEGCVHPPHITSIIHQGVALISCLPSMTSPVTAAPSPAPKKGVLRVSSIRRCTAFVLCPSRRPASGVTSSQKSTTGRSSHRTVHVQGAPSSTSSRRLASLDFPSHDTSSTPAKTPRHSTTSPRLTR